MPERTAAVRVILTALLVAFLFAADCVAEGAGAVVDTTLIGNDIPTQWKTEGSGLFIGSDSLFQNGRLLQSGVDYRYDPAFQSFDLSSVIFDADDTLRLVYRPVPSWVRKSYGRPLPEVSSGAAALPEIVDLSDSRVTYAADRSINLSGAKSFRFMARSAGNSEFGQSLNLNISGELSPGLELTGSVSDRGYNPSYGTANSRVDELDKINLSLKSKRLFARVGDITVIDHSRRASVEPKRGMIEGKQVSGASFDLSYPNWHLGATAARPRGTFVSFETTGRDGFQGPYQIGDGNQASPIVPGSETVWLDGAELSRGANKDYSIEYPTGRITFTALHLIDSRSRIEIDYEPQATDYEEELFAFGGGVRATDSLVYFSFSIVREGDVSEQPIVGELSESDLNLLALSGDTSASRSGVIADTSGEYILVVDSLPDSVYQHVGADNGDLSVGFSFVGAGRGDYRFLGLDNYEYVGPGGGDYAPIVILPAAKRSDYYRATVGGKSAVLGNLELDLRASSLDANLFSSIDDDDNNSLYYLLRADKRWQQYDRENSVRFSRRVREAGFVSRERLDRADFSRRQYLPANFVSTGDETIHDASATVSPAASVEITASYGTLAYDNQYDSRSGEIGGQWWMSQRAEFAAKWRTVSSDLQQADPSGEGHADNAWTQFSVKPWRSWQLKAQHEYDLRENQYTDEQRGTRFNRLSLVADSRQDRGDGETVGYEYYVEDSLTSGWRELLTRNRLSGASNRRLGDLSYDAVLSYQWLDRPDGNAGNLLARTGLRYDNRRRRLTVNTSYTISEERRNARGLTYLEVEPGFGNYTLEDGQFLPDPDGEYIQVEEILSDVARVRRAEKSFFLNKDWEVAQIKFNSAIEEELKDGGERKYWWALPFYADPDQPYLFFSRSYNAELRAVPLGTHYLINLLLTDDIEQREVAAAVRDRQDSKARLSLKEQVGNNHFEESFELFRTNRDSLFAGAGDVKGWAAGLDFGQSTPGGELKVGINFRRTDGEDNSRSQIVSLLTGTRFRLWTRGEFRSSVDLYRQSFEGLIGTPSYQLTGNKPGGKGAIWKLSFNYGVKDGMRLNFALQGRHSDDRTARVTGRGEVVAGF